MTAHAYTEDQLVEQSPFGQFVTLGWQTVSAMEVGFGADGILKAARLRRTEFDCNRVERTVGAHA